MGHLALVEEDVAAAPNIEDMLIHMGLLGIMGKAMKPLLVMAIIGLDVGLWRMVMTLSNSQKVICYVDDTLVKAMVSECLLLEEEVGHSTVCIIITLCFW